MYFVLAGVQLSEIKPSIIDSRDTLEIVNAVLFYLAFAYIVITPITTCFFLVTAKPEGLKNEVIMAHFGSLYKGLDIDSRLKLFQVTVFLLRRAIIGVTIAYCSRYYFTQLEIFLVSSMICLCYLMLARPYVSSLTNAVEMINEALIVCTVYFLHCFSFFVASAEARYTIGWVYMGIVGVIFLLNIGVILQDLILKLIKKLKTCKKPNWLQEWRKMIKQKKPIPNLNKVAVFSAEPRDPF